MSEEDYSAIELEETTRPFIKATRTKEFSRLTKKKYRKYKTREDDDAETKSPLLRRLPSFQSTLKPNFGSFRNSFRKLNCFKNKEEDCVPMMEIPRHKSIDIGVGLARRVSLFLFTRKTVCMHPYHPYTPQQTTRKLNFCFQNKHVDKIASNKR